MLRIIFKNKKLLAPIVLLFLIAGCKEDTRHIDVAGVEVSVAAKRFERELFSIQGPGVAGQINALEKKHPLFFTLFTKYIIRSEDKNDSLSKANLMNFVMDKEIQNVYKETAVSYTDFSGIQSQLTDGFRRYKKCFPGKVIPSVYTFISGFNYAVISADSLLGIGLDMYLGAACKYYPALGLPKYKINNMRKEFLVSDAMKGWMQSEYPIDETKKDFLSHIVYYGKLLYFQDMMLPDTPDTIKIGYTEKQLKWCERNEGAIWAHFINQKLLFSAGYAEYHKYINEGPTTNGFPKESPSLLGNWIGWQMVRNYMEENPKVTLAALFNETDAQKILTLSKYKPKK